MSYNGLITAGWNAGGFAAPQYAQQARNVFDPVSSRYNLRSGNKYQTRLAIGNAAAGLGIWDCAFIGASLELGYNGTGLTQDTSKQWPTKFRNRLAGILGVPAANQLEGVIPLSGQDDRTALTGATSRATAPAYVFANGAGTSSTTNVFGTDIWVCYSNAGTGNITVQVDGIAANLIPTLIPGGGNTASMVHVASGLANANHTVLLTYPAAASTFGVAVAGTSTITTSGFRFSNLALGGTSAAFGTQYTNWSDQTNAGSLLPTRLAAMAGVGIIPQTWFINLGSNDDFHGVAPATTSAGMDYIESQIPNLANGTKPDIFYIVGWNVTPRSAAQFAPMQQMIYSRCDNSSRNGNAPNGLPVGLALWDFNDQIGGLLNGIANGAIGADLIHPTYPEQEAIGDAVAVGFLA